MGVTERVTDDQIALAREVHVADVAELVGLERARERHKFACVGCSSSDGLDIRPRHHVAFCYVCKESWDAIALYQAATGADFVSTIVDLAGPSHDAARHVARSRRPAEPEDLDEPRLSRADYEADAWCEVLDLGELTPTAAGELQRRGIDLEVARAAGVVAIHLRTYRTWWRQRFAEAPDLLRCAGLVNSIGRAHPYWPGTGEVMVYPLRDRSGLAGLRFRRLFDVPDPKKHGKVYSLAGGFNRPHVDFAAAPFLNDSLDAALSGDRVLFVTEGEMDALTIASAGFPAVGSDGKSWKAKWCEGWDGLRRAVVLEDADDAEDSFAREVIKTASEAHGPDFANRIAVMRFGPLPDNPKADAGDWASHIDLSTELRNVVF